MWWFKDVSKLQCISFFVFSFSYCMCVCPYQVNIVIFINVIRILVQKLKSSAMAGNNDTGHFMWVGIYKVNCYFNL